MGKKPKKSPKKQEDEKELLICARTGGVDVLPGSVWDKCRDCGASVWVSKSGQAAMKQSPKMVPTCLECLSTVHKDTEAMEIKTAPGSLEELQKYLSGQQKQPASMQKLGRFLAGQKKH